MERRKRVAGIIFKFPILITMIALAPTERLCGHDKLWAPEIPSACCFTGTGPSNKSAAVRLHCSSAAAVSTPWGRMWQEQKKGKRKKTLRNSLRKKGGETRGRRCWRRRACGRRPSRRPCSPTRRPAASSPPASPSTYVRTHERERPSRPCFASQARGAS